MFARITTLAASGLVQIDWISFFQWDFLYYGAFNHLQGPKGYSAGGNVYLECTRIQSATDMAWSLHRPAEVQYRSLKCPRNQDAVWNERSKYLRALLLFWARFPSNVASALPRFHDFFRLRKGPKTLFTQFPVKPIVPLPPYLNTELGEPQYVYNRRSSMLFTNAIDFRRYNRFFACTIE